MKPSVLLYYPFKLEENANSGSKLRPKEIYKAFLTWGSEMDVEILLLSGSSKERKQKFYQFLSSGKLNNILFCYMENQTIPFWFTDKGHIPRSPMIDKKVFDFLKKNEVPVGVFYRDVYWKFDELYPLKGIKKKVMKAIYRIEEKFYENYCDVIFLPSKEMGAYVSINKKKVPLPPGGNRRKVKKSINNRKVAKGIYVGGINNKKYGLPLLLEALEIVNKGTKNCELYVVCRPDEYEALGSDVKEFMKRLGVVVEHISGEALNSLYLDMDFAFIPRYRSIYNDFSVPVKLVEYLSNELPVIATNCTAQKDFILSGNYGLICEDKPEDMARAIIQMKNEKEHFVNNIRQTFFEKHSWTARVRKIHDTLLKEEP